MSRQLARTLAAAIVGLVLAAPGGRCQDTGGLTLPRCSPTPPYFCADAAYFLADSSYVVEVYFRVCNDGLQFIKYPDGYRATADLSVVLRDGRSEQIAGDTYRVKLYSPTYAGTVSIDSCRTQVVAFRAREGGFRMLLGLYDRDSRSRGLAEADLSIPSLRDRPALSDLEFLEPGQGFYEGLRRAYGPKVRRIYSADRDSIAFYYEVYHGGTVDSLTVVETVTGPGGRKLWEASRPSVGKGAVAHLSALPGDSLRGGRCMLEVELKTPDGKQVASRSKDFEIRGETFHLDKDLDEAVAVLTYIATSSELDAFVKASEGERKRLWEEFWREKDPTPGTPRNEYLEEHLRRFRYSNERFGVPLTPGWKTDRGRIYILYGEPDEIESYPFEMGRKPTEIWTYYDKGRRFVFVDETGFGDYVLVGN
jgi:GWxTD domain-containing protein